MQAKYINPFLNSSVLVLEMMIQVKPQVGALQLKTVGQYDNMVWLRIGVVGQMQGDILFGFPAQVAFMIVSAMMGGYAVSELDEMSRSAIGELGNMISGNASTMLSNEGVHIDITPPKLLPLDDFSNYHNKKAISVPVQIDSIGEFELFVMVS